MTLATLILDLLYGCVLLMAVGWVFDLLYAYLAVAKPARGSTTPSPTSAAGNRYASRAPHLTANDQSGWFR
jgi:hypothetical protein